MNTSKKEIQVFEKQVSPLIKKAESYKIENVEDIEKASIYLKKLRDIERLVEAKRLEFTKPLNQSLRAINSNFKRVTEPLVSARRILTQKVVSWKTAERVRIEKEEARRRKIQEAHEKKGHEVKAPVYIERPDNKIGNVQTRKMWSFEVIDFSKLPDEYKQMNPVKIRQAVNAGAREIKGVRIYQEEKLSIVGS